MVAGPRTLLFEIENLDLGGFGNFLIFTVSVNLLGVFSPLL